ncbi:hypothetical protein ABID25_004062 [Mesorhizobium abyssinicae]
MASASTMMFTSSVAPDADDRELAPSEIHVAEHPGNADHDHRDGGQQLGDVVQCRFDAGGLRECASVGRRGCRLIDAWVVSLLVDSGRLTVPSPASRSSAKR